MSLPANTSYNPGQAVQSMAKAMRNIGTSMHSKKAVDVSKYQGLAGQIANKPTVDNQQSTVNQQAPQAPQTSGGYNLGQVSVPYGGNTRYEKFHPGVDIANKIGTQIPSFTRGKVTEVAGGKVQGNPGYGNYVIVTDEKGNKHRYSHLNQSFVKMGQPVTRGTVLGGMGNSGQTYSNSGGTGSHLDYRIKDLYGKYLNPVSYIKN